eukprot:COSAG04_NODE_2070_length_4866_cov_72.921334_4_plen_304_part_00
MGPQTVAKQVQFSTAMAFSILPSREPKREQKVNTQTHPPHRQGCLRGNQRGGSCGHGESNRCACGIHCAYQRRRCSVSLQTKPSFHRRRKEPRHLAPHLLRLERDPAVRRALQHHELRLAACAKPQRHSDGRADGASRSAGAPRKRRGGGAPWARSLAWSLADCSTGTPKSSSPCTNRNGVASAVACQKAEASFARSGISRTGAPARAMVAVRALQEFLAQGMGAGQDGWLGLLWRTQHHRAVRGRDILLRPHPPDIPAVPQRVWRHRQQVRRSIEIAHRLDAVLGGLGGGGGAEERDEMPAR